MDIHIRMSEYVCPNLTRGYRKEEEAQMKQIRRWISIMLVIALVAGFSVTASAADSIAYTEAVDLLEDLVINGKSVLDVLGGADLDGKAKQPLTRNEGIALINAQQQQYPPPRLKLSRFCHVCILGSFFFRFMLGEF